MAPDREGFASFSSAPKSIFSFKIYDLACGVGLWTVEIADPIYSPLAWGAGLRGVQAAERRSLASCRFETEFRIHVLFFVDGKVFMQWGSYPFLRILIPTAKDEFFFRYEYARVKFERDEKGNIAKMTWRWPGGEPLTFLPVRPQ
jgi:hypothetical protein